MASVCERCGATLAGDGCTICGDTLQMQADPLIGARVAGRYQVLRKLGQGGMGSVYLAEQVGLGHKVALKFLHGRHAGRPDLAQRFLNEARSYARIAHPHAITFHDFGQDEAGHLYISMEYVEGPDLATLLRQHGRLPIHEAVEIVLQVADALEHAHGSGVIHRDLKPENVIVRQGMRGPHAKVLDFGIAKLLDEEAAPLTLEGSIAGTPQYMPPEQIQGKAVDARADVYVLGVVLFELLTGRNPFAGGSIPEMLQRQASEPLPPLATALPGVDLQALEGVLQKATAKDREARFASMAAFATALVQATQAPGYREAVEAAAGLPMGAAPEETPGGTWVRGPGAQLHRPVTPPVEGIRGQTAILGSGDVVPAVPAAPEAPQPGAVESPSRPTEPSALQLPATEVPPPTRASGGEGARWARVVVLVVAAAALALLFDRLPRRHPNAVEEGEQVEVLPPEPEAPAVPAAEEAVAREAPTVVPAAADGKAEVVPADLQLRTRLLAREIWIKANAEFLAGNLQSASEILATVPEDEETAPRVRTLAAQIEQVGADLARARTLAGRGDCTGAIAVYDRILAAHPGFREAAAGRARCVQMLPPSIAD